MSALRLSLASVLFLVACRAAIPAATVPPRARVPASPPASLTACWVESAHFGPFTASSLVVRHESGDVVIDAGNSTRLKQEIRAFDGGDYRWLAALPARLRPDKPLSARLAAVGVDPQGLRWVLPTHAHLDHLGGVLDLPPTPVLLTPPEIDRIEHARHELDFHVMPAHARAVAGHETPLEFAGGPYEIFDRHADLFGDGSVVVVPLAGHTPGSVGVFVTLPDKTRIFHVGDAVNRRVQIEHRRGRSPIMRRTDVNEDQANETVARLHALAQAAPELHILPAHERDVWKALFGAPNQRCVSGR